MKWCGLDMSEPNWVRTDFFQPIPLYFRAELQKRNLSLIGAFVPLPLKDPARKQEAMRSAVEVAELLSACGAPFVVLADQARIRAA